ncbi:hypothetical protein DFQ26_002072 [Actinomortierella ambigua]|nr:hypothetical protein DFQ26_002072 [Actinomortierella ambigua]
MSEHGDSNSSGGSPLAVDSTIQRRHKRLGLRGQLSKDAKALRTRIRRLWQDPRQPEHIQRKQNPKSPYVLLEDSLTGILQIVPLIIQHNPSAVVGSGGTGGAAPYAASSIATGSHDTTDTASIVMNLPCPGTMQPETTTTTTTTTLSTSPPPSPSQSRTRTASSGSNSNSTISATRYQIATTMLQPLEYPLSEVGQSTTTADPHRTPPSTYDTLLGEPSLSSLSAPAANMEGTSPEAPMMAQTSRKILVDKLLSLSASFTMAVKTLCEQQHERVLRFDDDVIMELLLKWEQEAATVAAAAAAAAAADGGEGEGNGNQDDETDNQSTTSLVTLGATNALERYQITVGHVWEETEIIRSCIRKIREIVEFGRVQSDPNDFDDGDSEEDVLERESHIRKTIYSTLLFHTNALITVLGEFLECISSIQRLFGTMRGSSKSADVDADTSRCSSHQAISHEQQQQQQQSQPSHAPSDLSDFMMVEEPRPIRHLDPALTQRLKRKTRFRTLKERMRHQFSQFTKRSTDTLLAIFPPLGDGMNEGTLWDSDDDYRPHCWDSDDGYYMGLSPATASTTMATTTTMSTTSTTDRIESLYGSGGDEHDCFCPPLPISTAGTGAGVGASASPAANPSSPGWRSDISTTSTASAIAAAVVKRRPQIHRRLSSKGSEGMPEQYWPGSQPLHSGSEHGNWSDTPHSRLASPDLYMYGSGSSSNHSPSVHGIAVGAHEQVGGSGGGGGGGGGCEQPHVVPPRLPPSLPSAAGRKYMKRGSSGATIQEEGGTSNGLGNGSHDASSPSSPTPPQLYPLRTGPEDRARQSLLFRRRGSWQPKQTHHPVTNISGPLPTTSRYSTTSSGSDPLTPTKHNYKATPPPPPSDDQQSSGGTSTGSTEHSRSKAFSYLAVRTGTPHLQGPLILDSPFMRQTSIRMAHDRNRYSIRMPNDFVADDPLSSWSSSSPSLLSVSSPGGFRKRSSTTSSSSSSSTTTTSSSTSSSFFWRRRSFNDALERSWNTLMSENNNTNTTATTNLHPHLPPLRPPHPPPPLPLHPHDHCQGYGMNSRKNGTSFESTEATPTTEHFHRDRSTNTGGNNTSLVSAATDRPSVRLSSFDFELPVMAADAAVAAGAAGAGAGAAAHINSGDGGDPAVSNDHVDNVYAIPTTTAATTTTNPMLMMIAAMSPHADKSKRRHSSPLMRGLSSMGRRKSNTSSSQRNSVSSAGSGVFMMAAAASASTIMATSRSSSVIGSCGSMSCSSGSNSNRTSMYTMPTVAEHKATTGAEGEDEDDNDDDDDDNDSDGDGDDEHLRTTTAAEEEGHDEDASWARRPSLPTQAEVLLDQQESLESMCPFALPEVQDPTVVETLPRLVPGNPKKAGGAGASGGDGSGESDGVTERNVVPPRIAQRPISSSRFQDMKRAWELLNQDVKKQPLYSPARVPSRNVVKANGSSAIQPHSNRVLHICENGADVMVLEAMEGRLQVVAGRLEKLVERLADESTQDTEYVRYFILSHSLFIESEDLLDALIARFHIQPRTGELLYFQKWQAIIQVKVLCVIEKWIQVQYEDFELNANLLKTLKRFLENDVRMAGFVIEAECIEQSISIKSLSSLKNCSVIMEQGRFCLQRSRTRKISLSRSQNRSRNGSIISTASPLVPSENDSRSSAATPSSHATPTSASSGPPPLPPFMPKDYAKYIQEIEYGPAPELALDSPILDLDTRDLARYLTLADMSAFRSITIFELMTGWWKRRQATEAASAAAAALGNGASSPDEMCEDFKMLKLNFNVDSIGDGAIEAFTRRANMLSYWVAHEIISVAGVKMRKHLIKKFIEVAKLVSTRDMETLRSLEQLLDPTGNMKHYRQAMDNAEPPTIPFLPILLKDITFILDGNPTMIMSRGNHQHHHNAKNEARQGRAGELINFDKFRRLAQYVEQTVDMARLGSYSFEHQLLRQARVFRPSSPSTGEDPSKPFPLDPHHQSLSPQQPSPPPHSLSQPLTPQSSHAPSSFSSLSSASAAKLFFKSIKESASGGNGVGGAGSTSMNRSKSAADSIHGGSGPSPASSPPPLPPHLPFSSSSASTTPSTLGDTVKGVLDPISEMVENRLVKASGLYGVHQRVIQVEFVTRAKGSSGLWKPMHQHQHQHHGLGSPATTSSTVASSSTSSSSFVSHAPNGGHGGASGGGGNNSSSSSNSSSSTVTPTTATVGSGSSSVMSGGGMGNSTIGSGHGGGYRVIRTVQGEEDYLMGLSFMCEPGR